MYNTVPAHNVRGGDIGHVGTISIALDAGAATCSTCQVDGGISAGEHSEIAIGQVEEKARLPTTW